MAARYFDIGANLTDPVFTGIYRGKEKHKNDFEDIMARAEKVGLSGFLVTGGNLEDSRDALEVRFNIHVFIIAKTSLLILLN